MINVNIDNDTFLCMLIDRLKWWTSDLDVISLYKDMYIRYIDNDFFSGDNLDINNLVDNDYINYCRIIYPDEDDWHKCFSAWKRNEGDFLGGYVESYLTDDNDKPRIFLVRNF